MYQPKLNDVVSFYHECKICNATVIALDSRQADRMMVGWIKKQNAPSTIGFSPNHSLLKNGDPWKCVVNVDQYILGYWLNNDKVVCYLTTTPQATTNVASKSSGCSCGKCGEFYPWAEPNQLNGTLICWGCRTHRFYRGVM